MPVIFASRMARLAPDALPRAMADALVVLPARDVDLALSPAAMPTTAPAAVAVCHRAFGDPGRFTATQSAALRRLLDGGGPTVIRHLRWRGSCCRQSERRCGDQKCLHLGDSSTVDHVITRPLHDRVRAMPFCLGFPGFLPISG